MARKKDIRGSKSKLSAGIRATATVDISVTNHGSLFMLHGVTSAGVDWLESNLSADAQRLGDAFACEPRYVQDIVDGARRDGLVVS